MYKVFEVPDDSMNDGTKYTLAFGDNILCHKLKTEYWRNKQLRLNKIFVIVCIDEEIIITKVIEHDVEKGEIHCNFPHPYIEDIVVNTDDISEIYSVIKIVKKNDSLKYL
jgi:hypothetical protein